MATYRVEAGGASVTRRLGEVCNVAQDGDVVEVTSSTLGVLARRALNRLGKGEVSVLLVADAPLDSPPAAPGEGD